MTHDTRHEIARREVLYRLPGMDDVEVAREVEYGAGARAMDIYYPPASLKETRCAAVIIASGFPDRGFEERVGCKFKETGATVSWARLMAASGVAVVTYATRDPASDLRALLRHVRRNADALGLDDRRFGLWASSGNVPVALSALAREGVEHFKCALLFYGYTLDTGGATHVRDAARAWGFANPSAGLSVADLPPGVPLFVARAGRDAMPGLNASLDRFLAEALARDLTLTLTNHPDGAHAFDLHEDTPAARAVVGQALAFLRFALLAA
jgi:hypothetical protein